jgi:hypothetical protein
MVIRRLHEIKEQKLQWASPAMARSVFETKISPKVSQTSSFSIFQSPDEIYILRRTNSPHETMWKRVSSSPINRPSYLIFIPIDIMSYDKPVFYGSLE